MALGVHRLMAASRPPARHPFSDFPGPLAMAHRGFSRDGLENSLTAFAAAVDLGYRYLETDVRATSDGEVVAFHDEHLDRVTDGRGELSRLPWSRVRGARIGGREPIPRLEELLGSFPQARFNIDVKTEVAIPGLIEALRRTSSHDRVLVTAFGEKRRRAALAAIGAATATSASSVRTALALVGVRTRSEALVRASLGGVDAVQVPVRHAGIDVVTAASIDAVHRGGAQVHVWTIDDPRQINALLDLGVDGILTDRADVLR
ncbi:MAG: glycerophosphodiester phosphodiesterase family protein, partial [Janthinobacterium lividum]